MKNRVLNGFDRIAGIYDPMARLVYGEGIIHSQTFFLENVQSDCKVLILGGGTGWLLKELRKLQPSCEVWYIEPSLRMLRRAIRLNEGSEMVHFIHGDERDIPNQAFDVIITNFVLDLFEEEALEKLIHKILDASKSSFRWLAADFVDERKWWQQFMLGLMYAFFRLTCGIELRKLPRWREKFIQCGLSPAGDRKYWGGFIASMMYTLPAPSQSLSLD